MANQNYSSYRQGIKPQTGIPLIDLTGKRFGRLVVIRQDGYRGGKIAWLCKCDCGNEKTISSGSLTNGYSTSCGCFRKEYMKQKATKHLMTGSPLYYTYNNMKRRCYDERNDHYKWYGAENKTICDEWLGKKGFAAFAEWAMNNGYSDGLQIDRIDNSKGYSPDNCHFVTPKQNCRNKRDNHYITIDGETKTIVEWAEIKGIPQTTIAARINKLGWSEEKAVLTPLLKRRKE